MRWWSFKRMTVLLFLVAWLSGYAVDFTPSHVAVQAGGGMGIASVGTGWKYGSKKRWETDIFVGIIPKYDSSCAKPIISLKENFVPWNLKINGQFSVEPLTSSFYITSVLNDKFWGRQPRRYASGYYVLSTKYRLNLALGQRLTWAPHFIKKHTSLTAFYELSTCDIYILSAAGNSYLKPWDWLQLCIGIRLNL